MFTLPVTRTVDVCGSNGLVPHPYSQGLGASGGSAMDTLDAMHQERYEALRRVYEHRLKGMVGQV